VGVGAGGAGGVLEHAASKVEASVIKGTREIGVILYAKDDLRGASASTDKLPIVRHDRGQHGADILGRWLLALSEREEIASKTTVIVDFNQEVGQFHSAHVFRQPGLEVSQTVLTILVHN
jgi:hypothetical protein